MAAEVGRAALVELRLAGGLDFIVRDEDELIRRCRIRVDVHPKSYGDIVCSALQSSAVIAAREDEDEDEEAAVQGNGARDGAEADACFGRSVSSSFPPPQRRRGGGGLILTQSATHVISAAWRKRRISDVEVNIEDRARAEAGGGGDDDSSS